MKYHMESDIVHTFFVYLIHGTTLLFQTLGRHIRCLFSGFPFWRDISRDFL
jgi:hypothetical protein